MKIKDLNGNEFDFTEQNCISMGFNPNEKQHINAFLQILKQTGANPYTGDIYITRNSRNEPEPLVTNQFLLKVLDHNKDVAGIESGIITMDFTNGGNTVVHHIGSCNYGGNLLGAWATVYFKEGTGKLPRKTEVSYMEMKNEGYFWQKMPGYMIEKVAVSQLIRKIVPSLSGVYGEEEFGMVSDDDSITKPSNTQPQQPAQSNSTYQSQNGDVPPIYTAVHKPVESAQYGPQSSEGHAGNPSGIPDIRTVENNTANNDDMSIEERLMKNMTI